MFKSSGRCIDEADEDALSLLLKFVLRRDSGCIDVGSHNGAIVERCVQLAPCGQHFAIEPIPEFAAKTRGRCPGIKVFQVAISQERGKASFYYDMTDPGLSGLRLRKRRSGGHKLKELMVETCPLDELIPAETRIDFIKVDVEGAELGVLQSARQIIQRCRPHVVFEHGRGGSEYFDTHPQMIFELMVGEYDLQLLTLAGEGPLSREQFVDIYESNRSWNFVAKP